MRSICHVPGATYVKIVPILNTFVEVFDALDEVELCRQSHSVRASSQATAAIVTYLAETYGQSAGLIPPLLSAERAAYFEWCFFVMTELDAHTLYVIRKHTALAAIYSEAPNAVHAAREGFGKQVTVADRALARQGPFILGNTFTGADILLATSLDWAKRLEVSLTVTLGEYLERTTSRPPYRQAYVANQRR